ncbi:MAG TPA: S1 RNA-binding domain-containing protein, partial [Prolixibacteraceae bacterium]|nr:S1 RNA-binding domain-containing protein [Prolixibacteraceae bacterium]
KVDGLSYEVLEQALNQAREGRLHILDKIEEVISEPRADFKENVPRIEVVEIPKEMIGAVIGPGGKIIQKMQEETGTVIVIEEIDNIGRIEIAATNKTSIIEAVKQIKAIVAVPEVGEIYKGKVKSIVAFGAFIEILPGKDALLHISEIDYERHETVDEVLKEGQEVEVKLIGVDEKTGKLKLSRKVLLPKPEGYVEPERKPRGEGGDRRRDDRGGFDRRRDDRGGDRRRDDRGGDRRRDDRGGDRRNR